MDHTASNPIIESVRRAIGRKSQEELAVRPPIVHPRVDGDPNTEIERLLQEINALSGVARRLGEDEIEAALKDLVDAQGIQKACLWDTPGLAAWKLTEKLQALGVEVVSTHADKYVLAGCDLGVTEADFALPETGTLGLLSSSQKPRTVSLIPRVHLAVFTPQALRTDLHMVFEEARQQDYLILITGPSRTADIELTTTLGVHGPKALYAWIIG